MGRRNALQTNFSAGELAPELGMRQDTEQYRNGAKSLRNMRCLIGGGVTRRPGMLWLDELEGAALAIEFVVNQAVTYVLCFSAGRFDAFLPDGTAAGSLTGCPWTGNIWSELDWTGSGNTIILAHASMPPQVVTRTGAATWTRAAFTFFTGAGGRTEQPYFKIAATATTLAPSALTGSITLVPSADLFTANYVNTIVRYLGREILITAVTNPLNATGTVIEALPSTQTLTVTSSAKFAVGQVVLGDTSEARGQVTGVPDATHLTVVIIDGLTEFTVEDIIGPDGLTAISAVAAATPAAVTDFDQQLFSVQHGYPAVVKLHRNRLLFAGHPIVPNGLIGSRLDNLFSFDVGDASDADGFFETVGDAGAAVIVQLFSAEQLLVLTDSGPYYCPESTSNPFRPTSIAFFPFGQPWPITPTAKARAFDGGVIFVSGSLLIMARPTGNLTQSWEAEEVSLLSSHIIDAPTRIGAVSNFHGGPERYVFPINTDGTMGAVQIVSSQRIRNVTPWDTDGIFLSVVSLQGEIYATTQRTIDGVARYFLELFDQDVTLDLARTSADLTDVIANYGSETVNVVTGQYSLGTYPIAISGPPPGPYTVGFAFTTRVETLPPAIDGDDGPIAGDMMRHTNIKAMVKDSAIFALNDFIHSAYSTIDDVSIAPPLLNGAMRFGSGPWEVDSTIVVTQPHPLQLTLLALKSEVAS